MKTNPNSEEEDQLSSALRDWVVDTPLPPRFQAQVWSRIAAIPVSPWSGLLQLIGRHLARPKVAYACAAALLALGVITGSWTAQVRSGRTEATLGERYVQSIDPYQQASAGR